MNKLVSTLMASAFALSLAACQPVTSPPATAAIPEITIQLTDAGIVAPAEIPSGVVAITTENHLSPAKQDPTRCGSGIELLQLGEGVTKDALMDLLMKQEMPDAKVAKLLGGSCAKPDAPAHDIFNLQPGAYVALLMGDTPIAAEIKAKEHGNQAAAPQADVKVQMLDFSYALPDEIKAGPQLWEISNNGKQPHMLDIIRLNDGVALDDFFKAVLAENPSGPPPATEPSFWSDSNPGVTAWTHLNLAPGTYYAICFASDMKANPPVMHVQEGMVRMFKVVE
ncbi:MAG: hypothetical protein R3C14_31980 [Caldilineaceae bacterium]